MNAARRGLDGGTEPAGPISTRLAKEGRERATREAIVATTIPLADTVGRDAASIRRVAAVATRPTGLYSHIARKEDLIDPRTDIVLAA